MQLRVWVVVLIASCSEVPELAQQQQASTADPSLLRLCEVTSPEVRAIAAAEVALVPSGWVTPNRDGTYKIQTRPLTTVPLAFGGEATLDPSSRFYGEPQIASPDGTASAGRSGVMIGPDLVLTAPHGSTASVPPNQWKVVRGLGTGAGCAQPDWAHVPAQNVFTVQTSGIINSWESSTGPLPTDYMAFRLDRATGGPYVRIRRSGLPEVGDLGMSVHHGERMATLVAPDITFGGRDAASLGLHAHGYFALNGSSGGMFYNLTAGYLEMVEAQGGGCGGFDKLPNQLYAFHEGCDHQVYDVPARPIVDVASQFPAYSLVVSSVAQVTHVGAVNGAVTNPSSTYAIAAPSTLTGLSSWTISPPSVTGTSQLVMPAVMSGSLLPGQSTAFVVTATGAATCGIHTETVTVTDNASGFVDKLRHQFEIGMTEFTASPDEDYVTEQLVPPYGESKTYTLSNPRPTPVTVRIAVPSWIKVGVGTAAPVAGPVQVTLGASNSSSSTAQIKLQISVAGELPRGVPVEGDVTFTNLGTSCKITTVITHHIKLTPGKHTFAIMDSLGFPAFPTPPAIFGPPLTSAQSVPDDVVLESLTIDIPVYGDLTNIGSELGNYKFVLTAPDNTQLVLWDRTSVANGSPSLSYEYLFVDSVWQWVPVLHIADGSAPAPTGALLATLANSNGHGLWKLSAYSSGGWVAFLGWRLNLVGHRPCGVDWLPPCTVSE